MFAEQFVYFLKSNKNEFLKISSRKDESEIEISQMHMLSPDQYLNIWQNNKFYQGKIISIDGDTVKLDKPVNYSYDQCAVVEIGKNNVSIDPYQQPKTVPEFKISNRYHENSKWIISKITGYLKCHITQPIELDKFGNIPKLENGLVLIYRDENYNENIMNFKSNYDFTLFFNKFQFGMMPDPNFQVIPFDITLKNDIILESKVKPELILKVQDTLTNATNEGIAELIFMANIKDENE